MNVMVFSMAMWSAELYDDPSYDTPVAQLMYEVFRWLAMAFSLPVLLLLGEPIAAGVVRALARRAITTDLLILLGVAAAYGYSAVSVFRGEGQIYFEVGCMVLLFVSLGRWLEARGKLRASASLDELARLLPATVRRRSPAGDFEVVPREAVLIGDTLRVVAGERLPVDGRLMAGSALVDEQLVSGESQPVDKQTGDELYSGTLNLDGDLRVEVTRAAGEETVSRMLALVKAARREKGRHERLADQIATWFVPAVCLLALVAGWWQAHSGGVDQGILTALAVVLIACPCAVGLATPMALWTALGRAAESGVLFRSGLVLERLATVSQAVFDKTGTLTTGRSEASSLLVADGDERGQVLRCAAALAAGSNHRLSQAVLDFAGDLSPDGSVEGVGEAVVETVPGRGVTGIMPGVGRVYLGSRRWMTEVHCTLPADLGISDATDAQHIYVAWQGRVRGAFSLTEQLRPEASAAIDACRALKILPRLLSGDQQQRAAAIGQQLGIEAVGEQLPEEKSAALATSGVGNATAMIGDGLNDAPALARADVGVALGCGADLSRDAAGVCLMRDDLRHFPWAVGLARQTLRIVRQNLFWAFLYNTAGMGLAATGRLNPIWAALAMALSSLLVVTNSLRLNKYAGSPKVGAPSEYVHSPDASGREEARTAPADPIPAPNTAVVA